MAGDLAGVIYHDWKPGQSRGAYRLDRQVSDSVMGNLYAATRMDDNERFLILLLPLGMGKFQKDIAEKCLALQNTLSAVDNPHLLRLESVQRVDGRVLLVYRYRDVVSLTEWVIENHSRNPIDQQRARRFLLGLGSAIRDVRNLGLGHFFMTPDFVLLDRNGESAYLAGAGVFGQMDYRTFERYISSAIVPVRQPEMDAVRFSAIEILSPEIRNLKRIDPRSDFYCLGMVAYYMLIGRKPVRNWTLPTAARPDLNPGWDLFISHCLEPRPENRFPHAKSFIEDLERLDKLTQDPVRDGGRLLRTINRIPLPAAIEKRFSPLFLFYIRLSMLGVAGTLAIFTGYIFIEIIYSDLSPAQIGTQPERVSEAERANLSIELPMERIRVQVSGRGRNSFLVADGELHLRLTPGSYQLQFSSPFLIDTSKPVEVERDRKVIRVPMRPSYGVVRLTGAPPGALFWTAVGEGEIWHFLGHVDEDGRMEVDDRLHPDTFRFRIQHPKFRPQMMGPFDVLEGEILELPAAPEPLPATLHIEPPTDFAKRIVVRRDGAVIGTLPLRIDDVPANQPLRLHFSSPGYRPREFRWNLGPAEEFRWKLDQLVPQSADIQFEIRVRGRSMTHDFGDGFVIRTEAGQLVEHSDLMANVPVGRHQLRIHHPLLQSAEVDLTLADGDREKVELDMEFLSGRVSVELPDARDAQAIVNGRPQRMDEDGLSIPSRRSVEVRMAVTDFEPVSATFYLEPGESVQWSPQWHPLPGPHTGETWNLPYEPAEFRWVPPGSVRIGSPAQEEMRLPNEGPRTRVEISRGFWMMSHEVTQELYLAFVSRNPSRFEGARHPVDSVTWSEAVAFAELLTGREREAGRLPDRYIYRLPTEAEWEYAARAGDEDAVFHFGNQADPGKGQFSGTYPRDYATGRSPVAEVYGTVPVGEFQPNRLGIFDLHGNVAEWMLDVYLDRLPGGSVKDPVRTAGDRSRVTRGGSWSDSAHRARLAARGRVAENTRRDDIGFRLVLAPALPAD